MCVLYSGFTNVSILFRTDVAFKQQAAEQAKTPGLEPCDLMQARKDTGHDCIPQEHDRQAQEEGQGYDEANASDDGKEYVHLDTLLISCCASVMLGLMPS
jgi:hypothetical protein